MSQATCAISRDPWLSELMERDVWRVTPSDNFAVALPEELLALSKGSKLFAYVKVETAKPATVSASTLR